MRERMINGVFFDLGWTLERPASGSWMLTNRVFDHVPKDRVYALDEDVICVYADLDNLIERAELSGAERKTVDLVMKGYSLADIADHYGKTRQSFEILMKRAVKKIVRRNNQDWDACYWDN